MLRLRYAAAGFVALFALLTLADRFVLLELLVRRTALPLLFALIEALAIVAVGTLARRGRSTDLPLDFAIGYPLFGTIVFLASVIGGAGPWLAGLLFAGAAAGGYLLWQSRGVIRTQLPRGLALIPIAIVLGCGLVQAQAPPAMLDETAYHLAVPRTWAIEGRVVDLPLLSHSYFPMGIESADLPSFALLGADGGIASHFLHWLSALAATLLLYRLTRSWLATAAIVTTPALAITAGWSLVEWPLVAICVALVLGVRDETSEEAGDERGWGTWKQNVGVAAAATAAGLLTKYTFVPFAIVVFAVSRKWRPALIGALAGSVFLIRNLILTGNPIAPFFAGDSPHVSSFRDPSLASYVFEGAFIDEALGGSLLTMAAGATGLLPLALLACALVLFFLGPSSRILVPFLVIPAASAAPLLAKRFFRIVVAIAVVVQTFFVVWMTEQGQSFGLLSGKLTEEQYVAMHRSSFADVRAADALLPPGSRTLIVGVPETYWFSHPVRGGGNFDGPRLSRYLSLQTPEALRERLRSDGITHVAVLPNRVPTKQASKAEERTNALAPAAQRMLAQTLDRYAAQMTSKGDVVIFTLR